MLNEEMAQFLGVFLDEASEQLELLERAILDLEHNSTPELLQEIFRAAHTLKGSSRAMGFTSMGELTHAMEDVFDKLRQDEIAVSLPIVDALFEGLDLLKNLKEEIATAGEATTDTSDLTSRLRAVMDGAPKAGGAAEPVAEASAGVATPGEIAFQHTALTETARMAMQDAKSVGCTVYQITVAIASDCAMKSVRALMLMQSLETIGSILATTPDEEAIENEEFEFQFGLVFASEKSVDEIRSLGMHIAELTGLEITPLSEAGKAPVTPSAPAAEAPKEAIAPAATAAVAVAPAAVSDERILDMGPAARGKAPEEAKKAVAATQGQTVRVDVSRLDNLLNLVGELVIDQTRIAQLSSRIEERFGNDALIDHLQEAAAHFGRITLEMQEEIMKARMLPIDNVFNRFPRMIRDLAQKLDKDVDLVVSGRETELDRSVIEVIGDPLIHLLRNSVDHGVEKPADRIAAGKPEKGTVWLRARHEENHIVIEIEDDGKGLDPEKLKKKAVENGALTPDAAARLSEREAINLIFGSGFSTAEVVTDVSGRGVGMDIVKSNLTRFGALLDVDSKLGRGTRFTIKLPLTLAIIRGLLVKVSSSVYAVPLASVLETLRIPSSMIHVVNHREVIVQRGVTLPLVRLHELFHGSTAVVRAVAQVAASGKRVKKEKPVLKTSSDVEESKQDRMHYVVVVGVGDRQVGLVVESLLGEQEVVIKSLGKFVGDVRGISGATILGDGSIALIVDVNGLLAIATEEKVEAYAA
jgi:two-component system chemotaxis sensor kinase CheA